MLTQAQQEYLKYFAGLPVEQQRLHLRIVQFFVEHPDIPIPTLPVDVSEEQRINQIVEDLLIDVEL